MSWKNLFKEYSEVYFGLSQPAGCDEDAMFSLVWRSGVIILAYSL